jgi:hypothetical protein
MVSALKRLNYVYTLASLRIYASNFPVCSSLTLEGVFPKDLPHNSGIGASLLALLPSRKPHEFTPPYFRI